MATFIPLLWLPTLFFFTSVASPSFLSFDKLVKTRKATTIPPSWCAAKTGVPDASLQIALDYACGIGGADCSAIQQTGACYNPDTLHDHASYAFNAYYQSNPALTSCDFGGTAVIVYTDPIPNCANLPAAPSTNTEPPVAVLPPPPTLVPVVPVTTTPPSIPYTNPVMNPTLPQPTVPVTPPTMVLPPTIPYTTPVINPLPPPSSDSGRSWCVAKKDAMDAALQLGIDYACGIKGIDCSAIEQTGSCYLPNTVRDHASYAFNGYYQKNPNPANCDFGGTATIVNINPSSGTCAYPASSLSSPVLSPASDGVAGGGSTTVIGSTGSIGSNFPITSDNHTSFSRSSSLSLPTSVVTIAITAFFARITEDI